ncbi:MAG: ArsR/SmtB family transcription factor [Halobaculum sp.]
MDRRDVEIGTSEARARIETDLLDGSLDLGVEVDRLSAIGDETRILVVFLLAEDGPQTSSDLADAMDKYQNNLYYHLTTLQDVGLIETVEDGRSQAYRLTDLGESVVDDVFDSWRRRIGADSIPADEEAVEQEPTAGDRSS